ncbi:RNAse P Rpr2/Rpp21/SNM1 subunit domain-containing protein [Kickxella alabastrina]|uniref:RNAse P Rpr2/Rpp21/SNM1 subunit domain-containing protein n=1 Tax=Kickxella alabastrina TaxID=61397 RepID=UPI0022210B80|nr:RNAse P Rpr2/Rpp21/SNM1 subunit domain-containing protein [Kickxella alabastrina]KAI7834011.1 RNAse P Rpr2/Rpp21/SNM1 subunit domain-containing protein [Kickxella alabastrina]KAJ1943194.1 Ribonuclease P protein subunit p21 [Kickxella alabastrina]
MVKGSKPPRGGTGTLPNRELFERMNFLYQSSQFFASLSGNVCTSSSQRSRASDKASENEPTNNNTDETLNTQKSQTVGLEKPICTIAMANSQECKNSSKTDILMQQPLLPLARFYSKEMKMVARKSVLRMSPHLRRDMCKVCSTPLLPGVSCKKRVKGKGNGRRLITTCNYCGTQTRIMTNSGPDSQHVLFVDRPEHTTIH